MFVPLGQRENSLVPERPSRSFSLRSFKSDETKARFKVRSSRQCGCDVSDVGLLHRSVSTASENLKDVIFGRKSISSPKGVRWRGAKGATKNVSADTAAGDSDDETFNDELVYRQSVGKVHNDVTDSGEDAATASASPVPALKYHANNVESLSDEDGDDDHEDDEDLDRLTDLVSPNSPRAGHRVSASLMSMSRELTSRRQLSGEVHHSSFVLRALCM